MAELTGVPGGGRLWKIGSDHYLVYNTPKHGVPIAYRVLSDLDTYVPDGETADVTRTFTDLDRAEADTGLLVMGVDEELAGSDDHPFASMTERFDRLTITNPWLKDPEVLATFAAAQLEERNVSEDDLRATDYWQTHSEAERNWALLSMSDPETAAQTRRDNSFMILNTLKELGADDVPHELRAWINTQMTTGKWSQQFTTEQLRRLADPYRGELDRGLREFMQERDLTTGDYDTTQQGEQEVRELVSTWLGPHVADGWSNDRLGNWAARLRNEPNAEQELIDSLRRQRLAKYPAYEDPETTYEDIRQLWEPLYRNMWGKSPAPDDPTFERILQLNDAAQAEQILREEGLKRGNEMVTNDLLSGLHQAVGGSVRPMR